MSRSRVCVRFAGVAKAGLVAAIAVSLALSANRSVAQTPAARGAGGVTDERIANAVQNEPGSWLSYGQTYDEQRFSKLDQIARSTVAKLGLAWIRPLPGRHRLQATPLIVDGVLYVTNSWNVIYALNAKTGEEVWTYDPKTERHTGEHAQQANALLKDPTRMGFKVPTVKDV